MGEIFNVDMYAINRNKLVTNIETGNKKTGSDKNQVYAITEGIKKDTKFSMGH